MMNEMSPPRDLHERHFSRHVETAADVFWMRHNPFRDSLRKLEEHIRLQDLAPQKGFHKEDGDGEGEEKVEKDFNIDAIKHSCERLFNNVLRSCDTYLISYYDFVLATQDGRTLENRTIIQGADESRRRSHIALTTNIRVLVRNLKIWGIDTCGMEAFVIEHDMDAKRRDIGNFALHFAFSRYASV